MLSITEISLVFTFFNEENNCLQVIPPLIQTLEKAAFSFQMVLVNNGSVDKTGELLEQMARLDPRLTVAHVSINQGYGGGILEGLGHTTGQFIGYLSGDGQVTAEDVLKVLETIRHKGYDLVKAKRIVRGDGLVRLIVSKVYNAFMRIMFGCPSEDLNGTPKVFRRELLPILDLRSKDWFIDPEIMIKSTKLGLKIAEVPIVFHPRKEGKSSVHVGTIFEFLKNAFFFPFRKDYRLWKRQKLSSWQEA